MKMALVKVKGYKRFFSILTKKDDSISKSGSVFSGDLKIRGKLTIEGNNKALVIDEGSFKTKGVE